MQVAQLEALNFAGGGFRQFGQKLNRTRVLVRCQPLFNESFEFVFADLLPGLENDIGFGFGQPLGIKCADDGGFQNGRVLRQRGLNLEGRDVNTADFEHVVAAA